MGLLAIRLNRRLHDTQLVKHDFILTIDALHLLLSDDMIESDLSGVHLLASAAEVFRWPGERGLSKCLLILNSVRRVKNHSLAVRDWEILIKHE